MKQGQKVKWVDGMGFEQTGTVDFEATMPERIPVRTKDDRIIWVHRDNLE